MMIGLQLFKYFLRLVIVWSVLDLFQTFGNFQELFIAVSKILDSSELSFVCLVKFGGPLIKAIARHISLRQAKVR
jgi:hypothetical protein